MADVNYLAGWQEKRLACGHLELVPESGELSQLQQCGECDLDAAIALSLERYDSHLGGAL